MSLPKFARFGAGSAIAIAFAGCVQGGEFGRLGFDDNEAPQLITDGRYAVGDNLNWRITDINESDAFGLGGLSAASSDATTFEISPNLIPDPIDPTSGVFLTGAVLDAGSADVEITDQAGTLVDRITVSSAFANEVEVEPIQFGGKQGKIIGAGINIFETGGVALVTRLREGPGLPLKGQLPATAADEGPGGVTLAFEQDIAFELGERFLGFFDLVPLSLIALVGETAGTEGVLLSTVDNSVSTSFSVEVIPQDINLFVLEPIDLTPQGLNIVQVTARRLDNDEEIFGGNYQFTELDDADGLNISLTEFAQDAASYSVNTPGVATIQIDLLDDTLSPVPGAEIIVPVTVSF